MCQMTYRETLRTGKVLVLNFYFHHAMTLQFYRNGLWAGSSYIQVNQDFGEGEDFMGGCDFIQA